MNKILEMLTYKRPAGSATDDAFRERWIQPFKPSAQHGNLIVVVPGDPDTLFSCHTDTVHHIEGKQTVCYDEDFQIAYKDDQEPLGADNGAGCWLLTEMIAAGVPGTYAFHFGEERGCIGSRAMATHNPEWAQQFKRAIAFDRKGDTSVITHQMGERCCSKEFAQALATALGPEYQLDSTGAYTDTASYTELIPECTNISVGYDNEHGPNETLDVGYLLLLREIVLTLDWSALPTVRDPTAVPEWLSWADPRDDDDCYAGAIDLAGDEIHTLEDAEEMCLLEPKVAAQMLYALTRDYYAYEREPLPKFELEETLYE